MTALPSTESAAADPLWPLAVVLGEIAERVARSDGEGRAAGRAEDHSEAPNQDAA